MTAACDYHDVLNIVHRYYAAMDDRDWPALRALHADLVAVDFGGGFGDDGPKPADDLVALSASLLDPTELSHTTISNEIVVFDGNHARVAFYETAVFHHSALGDDPAVNTWTFSARGEMGLQRADGDWKVVSLAVRRVHNAGNSNLRSDIARA